MSHAQATVDLSERNTELGTTGSLTSHVFLAIGVVCLLVSFLFPILGIGGMTWDSFWRSWLQNWIFVLEIPLGAFFFVFIQHLTRAGWSVAVRRPAEVIASNLNWIWIGFLPIFALFFTGHSYAIFPWSDMAELAAHAPAEAHLVEGKTPYLNTPFFLIRAVIYFVVWAVLANWFLRASLRQGTDHGNGPSRAMQKAAGPAAILFGLTTTFAAFDWIMSLSPGWFSTMFGIYFFCGCVTCGFAAMILSCIMLQRNGYMVDIITNEHYQDMGKLLFGLGIVFWAYIGFSQYMLIWYANIPEETGWFLARQIGGWGPISLLLLFGHFVIPFVAIISKWVKRMKWALMVAAIWMLAFAWLDLFWLIMPVIPLDFMTAKTYMEVVEAHANDTTGITNPINFTMLAGVGGIYLWMTIRRFRSHRILAIQDPRLREGLSFENQ